MNYFQLINDSIDYIEAQIRRPISLEQLADRAYISRYHFLRIFKALTNMTPKEYIDARKLTEASKRLLNPGGNIVDIALEYGFESHEAFTRRCKRISGVTPLEIKRGLTISGLERMEIVERDFTNRDNKLYPSYKLVQMTEQLLFARKTSFDPEDITQLQSVQKSAADFVEEFSGVHGMNRLYGVVYRPSACGRLSYYTGIESKGQSYPQLEPLILPTSQYAVFTYIGSLGSIYDTVFADVCTALLVSEKQLNRASVELFEVYEKDYARTNKFSVFIPVR